MEVNKYLGEGAFLKHKMLFLHCVSMRKEDSAEKWDLKKMTQIKAEKYENDVKSKQIGQSDKLPDRNGRSAINSLKKKKKEDT